KSGIVGLLFWRIPILLVTIARFVARRVPGDGAPNARSYAPMEKFDATIYEAEPPVLLTISGVLIAAFDFVAARFSVENEGTLAPGSEYRFQVQQIVKDQVVGGSVYVVRIAGEQAVPVWDGKLEEVGTKDKLQYLPNWIQEVVQARVNEL
ncbi:MAG: hypothetical protein M3328_12825, partial [Chloroflexota bacterium]|nr:hypothetical protein [Chloroflexota bacterium]